MEDTQLADLLIIGGGVNGCGIAREAAGKGLKVVLAEQGDLACATSSCSSKLIHGGLRYLEQFDFRLVKKSLAEREKLLRIMPHICRPMRFVLPHDPNMQLSHVTPATRLANTFMPWLNKKRPAWMVRSALFLYDHLSKLSILPGTIKLDRSDVALQNYLDDKFVIGFEYSDCWIDDARLVVLNAQDAKRLGAKILTQSKVTKIQRKENIWEVSFSDSSKIKKIQAKAIVNAAGPWLSKVIAINEKAKSAKKLRLVRGSHVIFKKFFDHDRSYILSGEDGRIIFAIPYENDYTLVGTTEVEQQDPKALACSDDEIDYLIDFLAKYFKQPPTKKDIVHTYSGVRPLAGDDGPATLVSRDYSFELDTSSGAPILNILGGKLTSYRKLAKAACLKLDQFFPEAKAFATAKNPLPGGDFLLSDLKKLQQYLIKEFSFVDESFAYRLINLYGTNAKNVLGSASTKQELGEHFGVNLYENEVRWLMKEEFASCADDVLWRRTKLGLIFNKEQVATLDKWMEVNQ